MARKFKIARRLEGVKQFSAWYLSHDETRSTIDCHPANETSVRKYRGQCSLDYYMPRPAKDWTMLTTTWGLRLTPAACKKMFGHAPEKRELLLVVKRGKTWRAQKIDLAISQ